MHILLSIKPKYASRIFAGTKKYEFRKTIPRRPEVTAVLVYVSSPVCRVIGEFTISEVLSDSPIVLWERTKEHAGISRESFLQYFAGKELAHAIAVGGLRQFKQPRLLADFEITAAPQSFRYVECQSDL